MKLILFTGPNCGLCEQAKVLVSLLGRDDLIVEEVNVRNNVDLYHRYGARIPVLKRDDSKKELGWIFDSKQLEEFLT